MTQARSPALNLRAALAKLARLKPAPEYHLHWFDGGAASYTLPAGWRSLWVSVDGEVKRGPDPLEAYTTSVRFNDETVTLSVAVPDTDSVGIFAKREVRA